MKAPPAFKRRAAFTQLELLLAIVLTLILAAALFTLAQGSVYRAREATCAANLRSLGQGMMVYAADHNNTLPSSTPPFVDDAIRDVMGTDGYDRLLMALYSYVKNQKVFQCPIIMHRTERPYLRDGRYRSTYNQNVYTFAAKVSSLPNPANLILLYEGGPQLNIQGTPPRHTVDKSPVSSILFYHSGPNPAAKAAHLLMADGHLIPNVQYFGSNNPGNTVPADGGIWGATRYTFNR